MSLLWAAASEARASAAKTLDDVYVWVCEVVLSVGLVVMFGSEREFMLLLLFGECGWSGEMLREYWECLRALDK